MSDTPFEKASTSGRAVAAAAYKAFQGRRKVLRIHHGEESFTDILRCEDSPVEGWTSYSSLTLHRSRNLVDGQDISVEIAGVCGNEISGFAEAIADACEAVRKGNWFAAPEILFADVFGDRIPDTRFPHLLLCPPYPWKGLSRIELPDGGTVHWLMAFPISESERQFFLRAGFDQLESIFLERQTEYFDLARQSEV
ncbi:suppressor of fused domain protein [Maritimibacter sp. 55A14]|uniref:suppressor of fused domain protein n=1 Tax=Maritimibacter sp. 55A14 TaxID=2174844 RepID=UPI001304F5FA|nr:suppressor of fused domain protein [Maritimibacter sp. 55A14]